MSLNEEIWESKGQSVLLALVVAPLVAPLVYVFINELV